MPFLFLCAILFLSCGKQSGPPETDLLTRTATIQTEQTDREILQIAEDARRTLPIFFRHLSRPDSNEDGFCVKHPFMADDQSGIVMEQIWLTDIYFKDGAYYGVLASSPMHLSGMKKGDTVTFEADLITDWMYVHNGKIAGGRSIKYLLEKIPESQRSEEQRKTLQMFED